MKKNLTGLEFPRSSVVDPMLGGSTMTSYMIPGTSQAQSKIGEYKLDMKMRPILTHTSGGVQGGA